MVTEDTLRQLGFEDEDLQDQRMVLVILLGIIRGASTNQLLNVIKATWEHTLQSSRTCRVVIVEVNYNYLNTIILPRNRISLSTRKLSSRALNLPWIKYCSIPASP